MLKVLLCLSNLIRKQGHACSKEQIRVKIKCPLTKDDKDGGDPANIEPLAQTMILNRKIVARNFFPLLTFEPSCMHGSKATMWSRFLTIF